MPLLASRAAPVAAHKRPGSAAGGDWTATDFENGEIVTGYAGGCLWANVTEDEELQALVLGATVTISTDFSATRRSTE